MILAGASMDDIYVIVLFSSFLTASSGGTISAGAFASIPVSIITGIAGGLTSGVVLSVLLRRMDTSPLPVKVIMILAPALLLISLEDTLKPYFAFSGLLAVVASAAFIKTRDKDSSGEAEAFSRLWKGAEILLFVLIGAAVDIRYTLQAGGFALIMLAFSLTVRSIGVLISLIGTDLNAKERIFTCFAYLPKATVQAAIGGVPLAMGLASGQLILSVAVLSIVITAPLGALLMEVSYRHLLTEDK